MGRPIDYAARNLKVAAIQKELAVDFDTRLSNLQIAQKLHCSLRDVTDVRQGRLTIVEPGEVPPAVADVEKEPYKDFVARQPPTKWEKPAPVLTVVGQSLADKPIIERVPDPPSPASPVVTSSEFKSVQHVIVGALTRAETIEELANMARNTRLCSKARRAARQAMEELI